MKQRRKRQPSRPSRPSGLDTIEERKGLFITALTVLRECPSKTHTVITEDRPSGIPLVAFVQEIIQDGAALESAMGKDVFYQWLDRFIRATPAERAAMWENKAEW